MRELGRPPPEVIVGGQLPRRVRDVVLAADDVRDVHLQIVYDVDEVKHGLSVRALDDEIVQALKRDCARRAGIDHRGDARLRAHRVGVDADGQPITPVYTYADTRATEDAQRLRQLYDEASVQDRTGCLMRASYLPARFVWLQREQPDLLKRATYWLSLGEFLFDRWFGRSIVSTSLASWSGLLDRRSLQWDTTWFNSLPVSVDQFSPLVDVSEPLRGLMPDWAARWPALRDVPWFPAVGDGAAANIGSGCTSPDQLALTLGTSGALRIALPGAPQVVPGGLWCYRIDRATSLLGGATNEGGNVYTWLRQTLHIDDDRFDEALAALEPDSHGLTALPFIAGERSPGWAGEARAAITSLTIDTQPIEIARAMFEAVAYRFALIAQQIEAAQPPKGSGTAGRLIASGGGLLRHPAWLQIFADVLDRPVTVCAEPEATSRGAALLALRSIGAIESLDELPAELGETYTPDATRHAVYVKAIKRQRTLYDLLVRRDE